MASPPPDCARSLGEYSTAIPCPLCPPDHSSKKDVTSDIIAYYV
ncbi:unnamed protein product [Staurois parvus]|uniref:Uncharacterized protein n=1 Tax=Staurois parvus TaxID=386267 RepID=A0ABN9D7P2_9NEOB|nr:unnamed protein product [Staurois parvus]